MPIRTYECLADSSQIASTFHSTYCFPIGSMPTCSWKLVLYKNHKGWSVQNYGAVHANCSEYSFLCLSCLCHHVHYHHSSSRLEDLFILPFFGLKVIGIIHVGVYYGVPSRHAGVWRTNKILIFCSNDCVIPCQPTPSTQVYLREDELGGASDKLQTSTKSHVLNHPLNLPAFPWITLRRTRNGVVEISPKDW